MKRTFLKKILGIKISSEELRQEIEEDNHQHYLELKRKTIKEAEKYGLTVKEAILAGYPLINLTRKHSEELRGNIK